MAKEPGLKVKEPVGLMGRILKDDMFPWAVQNMWYVRV